MEETQFKDLCQRMSIGRSISYGEFLDHFQSSSNLEFGENLNKTNWVSWIVDGDWGILKISLNTPLPQSPKLPLPLPRNHKLLPSLPQSPKIVAGAPVTAMPYQEALALLRSKIQNSYRNLRAAFHAIDRDGDGLINRTDLVAILTNLLIPMNKDDISDMWSSIAGRNQPNQEWLMTSHVI